MSSLLKIREIVTFGLLVIMLVPNPCYATPDIATVLLLSMAAPESLSDIGVVTALSTI